jgi:hypothetical protein
MSEQPIKNDERPDAIKAALTQQASLTLGGVTSCLKMTCRKLN